MNCKTCGHDGLMHCDGENSHVGECVMLTFLKDDSSFCECKEFKEHILGRKKE